MAEFAHICDCCGTRVPPEKACCGSELLLEINKLRRVNADYARRNGDLLTRLRQADAMLAARGEE